MNEGGDIPFVSAAECRELDRRAIEEYGIPGLLLMEHASLGAAVRILEVLERPDPTAPVRIVCGPGNNGGDGYAIARHLLAAEIPVDVIELIDPVRLRRDSDPGVQRDLLIRQGVTICTASKTFEAPASDPALWVDAIFGTGLAREPAGRFAQAIEAMNSSLAPVLAIDIPSGLDADRGAPVGMAVRARWTVTFGAAKIGFAHPRAAPFIGALSLVSIGLPASVRPPGAAGFPPLPAPVSTGN